MRSFVGRMSANHAPVANGRVLAELNQYQIARPVDRIHAIQCPFYSGKSFIGEAGIQTVVQDFQAEEHIIKYKAEHPNREYEADPVRYDFYQGYSFISIDNTRYVDGTGIYQVDSHRGHIGVRTTTWASHGIDSLVRKIEVRTHKQETRTLEVFPQVEVFGKVYRIGNYVINKVNVDDEDHFLAFAVTDCVGIYFGDLDDTFTNGFNDNLVEFDMEKKDKISSEVDSPDSWRWDLPNTWRWQEVLEFTAARSAGKPNISFKVIRESAKRQWSKPVYLVVGFGSSEEEAVQNLEKTLASPDCHYTNTYEHWSNWLKSGKTFDELSGTLKYFGDVSKTIMKMSLQHDELHTYIGYHRYKGSVWIRDNCWVIASLAQLGHTDDSLKALRALKKILKTREDGNFCFAYNSKTGEPHEFTKENDSTGLLLFAMYYHYKNTGDVEFLREFQDLITACADWIVNNLDETGMVPPCAGIWEDFCPRRTRENMHMVWTSGVSAFGLKCAVEFTEALGLNNIADKYRNAFNKLFTAVKDNCIKDGILTISKESSILDSAALLFFSWMKLFDAEDPVVRNTVNAVEERISDPAIGGIWRHEDLIVEFGDGLPWHGSTLWFAEACIELGDYKKAWEYIKWSMDNSSICGLIPECTISPEIALCQSMPSYSHGTMPNTLLRLKAALDKLSDKSGLEGLI